MIGIGNAYLGSNLALVQSCHYAAEAKAVVAKAKSKAEALHWTVALGSFHSWFWPSKLGPYFGPIFRSHVGTSSVRCSTLKNVFYFVLFCSTLYCVALHCRTF